MPELPDIMVYIEALQRHVLDQPLERVRIVSPFLIRSVEPPADEAEGRLVVDVRRLGKRIVLGLGEHVLEHTADPTDPGTQSPGRKALGIVRASDPQSATPLRALDCPGLAPGPLMPAADPSPTLGEGGAPDLFLVFHLMIAGRFRWLEPGAKPPGKITLAVFDFPNGTLGLTEAGTKRRASLHLVQGEAALAGHDPGGLEVVEADAEDFRAALTFENHTLKRALTDPRLFSGIGNAYSDEILHAARLSPIALTHKLTDADIDRLRSATRDTLERWTDKLRRQFAERFPGPGEITAIRPDFAVHGRFGRPCPACGAKVQRIRYAENETNYCPGCQTGGRILADRSLSRLLKNDWPRTLDELETR